MASHYYFRGSSDFRALAIPNSPSERRRHCREDFSLDKWHHLAAYFAPRSPSACTSELPQDEDHTSALQHTSVHMPEAIHPTSSITWMLHHTARFSFQQMATIRAHQDQIIATQAQHTTILHQIQQHLSMQTPLGHDRSAPSKPLVPMRKACQQPISRRRSRRAITSPHSYLIFYVLLTFYIRLVNPIFCMCTPYLLYTQTLSHSGESQESNGSNHLRDNFAQWKSRWRLYFDGAANQLGFGIGILLISPQGDHIPRSVRFAFSDHHLLTNNVVEYEACITGIETALDLRIIQLEIHEDFNLVIQFEELRYIHLPRAENQFVDALATLASVIEIPVGVTVRPLLIETSGHEYILVAIDYFTKWVEATSYARLIVAKVAKFIISHIIFRYGVPHELILDRGVHFRAYRTSFRTSTGATPYSLVYGMEAVLPIEFEIGSLRAYQRKMTHVFKKRVKPRKFQKGDLVLKVLKRLIRDPRGKFKPSWSRPYLVKCGSAEEVLHVRSWSEDGWPLF
ncbi:hypothetical protein AAG906_030892 [Vitis piasezkii]